MFRGSRLSTGRIEPVLKHVNRESDPRGLRLSLRRQISPLGWVSASSGPGQDHKAPSLQLGRGLPSSADGAGPRELLRPQETAASPPPPTPTLLLSCSRGTRARRGQGRGVPGREAGFAQPVQLPSQHDALRDAAASLRTVRRASSWRGWP